MKRIYSFIAVIILLSLLLSGCNNGSGAASQTTEIGTTITEDEPTDDLPDYSEEQLTKLILKTLSEEEIDFYKSPTYDECICRLFKDFTWTYTSLPEYDYLYVATFTGTYYSNPRSYYDLGENTAHGSLSLLVDIRDKEDVEGSARVRGYHDNYDQTERIIYLFCKLVVDCPQRT